MFQIKINNHCSEYYYNNIRDFVVDRLAKCLNEVEEHTDKKIVKLLFWLNEEEDEEKIHVKRILLAKPKEFPELYRDIYESFINESGEAEAWGKDGCHNVNSTFKKVFLSIFDYDAFSKNRRLVYSITEKTGVKVCPYCNRQYIFTVKNEKEDQYFVRPELDHFFARSLYPMFALSYYNLIPSCHVCNSNLKGAKQLNIKEFYHPYIQEPRNLQFSFELLDWDETFICINYGDEKARNTAEFFKLEEIYNHHTDEADRLLERFQTFPPEQICDIVQILCDNGISIIKEQLLDIIYSHYNVTDPDNEILGHLRSDLYRQLIDFY